MGVGARMFYRVAVIGVGLIGGSIAKRLKFSGWASYILGLGRNPERLALAKNLGIIDEYSTDYQSLSNVDIIILATPLDHILSIMPRVLEMAKSGAIVLDVASVKLPIVRRFYQLESAYPEVYFIPTHPIAGSHFKGFEYAKKELFMGSKAVICPLENPDEAVEKVKLLYNFLGMDVVMMDPELHDKLLAYSSHLPHLISFVYRDIVSDDVGELGGGSFRDLTRVSNSDIRMWNGIFRHNRENMLSVGREFLEHFSESLDCIEDGREVVISFLPAKQAQAVYSVAIDGPAGAGKSTIAKLLAQRLGFRLVDTGAMYRAATLACMRKGIDLANSEQVLSCIKANYIELTEQLPVRVFLNGEDVTEEIRKPEVTNNVFYLAKMPQVREHLVAIQRSIALKGKAVLEGRDITTVVIPEARFKFYLDASFQERFKRRYNQLKNNGIEVDPEKLKEDMIQRDANDLKRDVGPLRKSKDAFYIDSTNLTIEETLNIIYYEILRRIANEKI